jgi:hypothetical protein
MTEPNDSARSLDSASEDVKPKKFLPSTSANLAEESPPLPILQERTRSHLAKFLIYSFVGTVVAVFITIGIDKYFYYTASDKKDFKDQTGTKDLINLVLTTQSTLVAAAIGFYFGTRDTR